MAIGFHVDGPALIKLGTGAANALELLGISEDGVDIEITPKYERVMTDVAGPSVPAELQAMGADARIRMRLVSYDLTVLQKILKLADSTTEGELPTIGALVGTGSYAKRLLIDSAAGTPYNFLTAVLEEPQKVKISTKRTPIDLHFYAWAFVAGTATAAKDTVLYNHTNT